MDRHTRPSSTAKLLYLTKGEVERFFAAIPRNNLRDLLLFELMYWLGLRRREATMIRVTDDLLHGIVWIERVKHGDSHKHRLRRKTLGLLRRYLRGRADGDNPYLFPSRQSPGAPISASTVYYLFRRYAEAADLPADRRHPHVLRHSIAVHWMNTRFDIADVMKHLGHKDIKSTQRYAAVTDFRMDENYRRAGASKEIAKV
jgi:integrase